MKDTTLFQYCQKLVLFRNDGREVLLAKRTGEADYDGTYTFVGGKMETTDADIVAGLKREKDEEIGSEAQISVYPKVSYNVYFLKKDGNVMIIPHYYAVYVGGQITLNSEEYSDFAWVAVEDLEKFEPKVANIPEIVRFMQRLKTTLPEHDFVTV